MLDNSLATPLMNGSQPQEADVGFPGRRLDQMLAAAKANLQPRFTDGRVE